MDYETDESQLEFYEGSEADLVGVVASEVRENTVENVTNRILSAIFQRDGLEESKGAKQSLQVYAADGTQINPSEGEYGSKFHTSVQRMVFEASKDTGKREWTYMAMLVPSLVGALVQTEEYVDRIYEPDLINVVQIAIDWFKNPQAVDQTHIRVGYGGETMVNCRVPSYLVPSLRTINEVHAVFARHGNWAIHHELHDALVVDIEDEQQKKEISGRIDAVIKQKLDMQIARLDHGTISVDNSLEEILSNKYLSVDQVRGALVESWEELTGQNLPNQRLEREYHFTDKVPTLVVFNGANAAIEINRKDEDQVHGARDTTQRFLQGFIARFYPHLKDSVVFQNDTLWSEHDYYTQMMILYTYDVINEHSRQLHKVNSTLSRFAEHHSKNGHNFAPIPSHALYAVLHPHFFADPIMTKDRADRLPPTRIMEKIDVPRHVIVDQAPPELTFGEYRKMFAEHASRSGFIEWLNGRYAASLIDMAAIAQGVMDRAIALQQTPGKKGQIRALKDCVYQALNEELKERSRSLNENSDASQLDVISDTRSALQRAKNQFLDALNSDFFRHDDPNEVLTDEDVANRWSEYIEILRSNKPEEDSKEIRTLITQMQDGKDEVYKYIEAVTESWSGMRDNFSELASQPQAREVFYPRSKLERTLPQGEKPAYYVEEGVDTTVWPTQGEFSLAPYESYIQEIAKKQERLKATVATVTSRIEKRLAEYKAQWELLGPAVEMFVQGGIDEAMIGSWMEEDAQYILTLCQSIDDMEVSGKYKDKGILEYAEKSLAQMIRERVVRVAEDAQCDQEWAGYYIATYMPHLAREAGKSVMAAVAATAFQANAMKEDVRKMLEAVHPDRVEAERLYNEFIREFFSSGEVVYAD